MSCALAHTHTHTVRVIAYLTCYHRVLKNKKKSDPQSIDRKTVIKTRVTINEIEIKKII